MRHWPRLRSRAVILRAGSLLSVRSSPLAVNTDRHCVHICLGLGIVIGIATSAHGADVTMFGQQMAIVRAGTIDSIVDEAFRRRAILEMEPRIFAIANELAAELFADGSPTDLVERYARKLPPSVICELLGNRVLTAE